jgi:hypothetical protein
VALLAILLLLLITKVVTLNLDHDEHQFIASGLLLARDGRLPYRDYAYFHVPLLVFVYALLFRFTDYALLATRLFSTLCSWLLLVALFLVPFTTWQPRGRWKTFGLASTGVLLLAFAPIHIYTSGRAWNHDLAVLLALLALLAHLKGLKAVAQWPWLGLSGLLLGLASATRLAAAPMFLPLLLAIWLWPNAATKKIRGRATLVFLVSVVVGFLPALICFGLAPQGFLFGNLEYARLNTAYRATSGYGARMTLATKLAAFGLENLFYEPGNLLLLLAYLLFGLPFAVANRLLRARFTLLAGVIVALAGGALAPTPSWPQYFYLLFPFFTLGALWGLCAGPVNLLERRWFQTVGIVALLFAISLTASHYQHLEKLWLPSKWLPVEFHQTSLEMAALAGEDAQVLTLSPALPLEGKLAIYPELVTGPFALRAARFIADEAERPLHLVDPARLESWLQATPPPALLTGVHPGDVADEEALVAYAQRHAYTGLTFEDGETLWLTARARWENAFQLVTASGLPERVLPGATITPVLFLENLAPLHSNLNVTLRVVDQAGATLVQSVGWPQGRPTSAWQPNEIWYDGHTLTLPPNTPAAIYRLEVDFYDPTRDLHLPVVDLRRNAAQDTAYVLGYFTVGAWPPLPAVTLDPPPVFGAQIALLGYAMPATIPARHGEPFRIQLGWQPQQRLDHDYTAFVHLVGPDGKLVAQQDKQPLEGFYPTSRWRSGSTIVDEFVLTSAQGLPAGTYALYTGWYDLASGARLTVTNQEPPVDAWLLMTILIQ